MNNLAIAGPALPDMPWEDRPAGSNEVIWHYSANPIISHDTLPRGGKLSFELQNPDHK